MRLNSSCCLHKGAMMGGKTRILMFTANTKIRVLLAAAVACIGACGISSAETYTLNTYYPSPVGVYNSLRVTSNVVISADSVPLNFFPNNHRPQLYVAGSAQADIVQLTGYTGTHDDMLKKLKQGDATPAPGRLVYDQGNDVINYSSTNGDYKTLLTYTGADMVTGVIAAAALRWTLVQTDGITIPIINVTIPINELLITPRNNWTVSGGGSSTQVGINPAVSPGNISPGIYLIEAAATYTPGNWPSPPTATMTLYEIKSMGGAPKALSLGSDKGTALGVSAVDVITIKQSPLYYISFACPGSILGGAKITNLSITVKQLLAFPS